ncbi:hypothetical protein DNTS_005294, partial [Danionella cerebrum]
MAMICEEIKSTLQEHPENLKALQIDNLLNQRHAVGNTVDQRPSTRLLSQEPLEQRRAGLSRRAADLDVPGAHRSRDGSADLQDELCPPLRHDRGHTQHQASAEHDENTAGIFGRNITHTHWPPPLFGWERGEEESRSPGSLRLR